MQGLGQTQELGCCVEGSGTSSSSPSTIFPSSSPARNVKVLDISGMDVVYRGKVWNHSEDPCARCVGHIWT